MNARKIAVYGDGRHELGGNFGCPASGEDLPALPRIIDRLLNSPANVSYIPLRFADVPHVAGKGPKLARKVQRAILLAKAKGLDGIVILIDRDRKPDNDQIKPLRDGRNAMQYNKAYVPCAVGTAVETFDAWMIADGNAVGKSGGNSARCHPEPEAMNGKEGTGEHPKDRAAEIFGSGQALGHKYAQIAVHVDLDRLKKCCPKGFSPFADEVKVNILPAIQ